MPDAETHFDGHEFLDVTVQPKPIYISPNEVYAMHSLLAENIDILVSIPSLGAIGGRIVDNIPVM